MPLRRAAAEGIARSILDPFIKMELVTPAALENAITIIELRLETYELEQIAERAGAAANMHNVIAKCVRELPR